MLHLAEKITRIPLEGGSGNVPSGAMQFDHDWPGLFLRGDVCTSLKYSLEEYIKACKIHQIPYPSELEELMTYIETHVIEKDSALVQLFDDDHQREQIEGRA